MRLYAFAVVACATVASVVLWSAPDAQTDQESTPSAQVQEAPKVAGPQVVRSRIQRPRRVLVVRSRFTPWARPSVPQVLTIIREESRTQGVSESFMRARISCESGYQWNNSYAGHLGLGQFLESTWQRALPMPRSVRRVTRRWRTTRVVRFERMSDGTLRRTPRWRIRQQVVHVQEGLLPRHPDVWHGWAQVRAVARAIAGRGGVSSSEWTCPL